MKTYHIGLYLRCGLSSARPEEELRDIRPIEAESLGDAKSKYLKQKRLDSPLMDYDSVRMTFGGFPIVDSRNMGRGWEDTNYLTVKIRAISRGG